MAHLQRRGVPRTAAAPQRRARRLRQEGVAGRPEAEAEVPRDKVDIVRLASRAPQACSPAPVRCGTKSVRLSERTRRSGALPRRSAGLGEDGANFVQSFCIMYSIARKEAGAMWSCVKTAGYRVARRGNLIINRQKGSQTIFRGLKYALLGGDPTGALHRAERGVLRPLSSN